MARKRSKVDVVAPPPLAGWKWGGTEEVEKVTWLWEPWIPGNALSLVCGDPQMGKSTLLAHLAAMVTSRNRGKRNGTREPDAVLWVRGEEPWGMATAPRLEAAGADLSRVIRADKMHQAGSRVTIGRLQAELPQMISAGLGLVIIDPLAALAEEGSDWTSEGSARQTLDTLMSLAESYTVPIIGARNWNKRQGCGRLDRIMGSAAFRDVPRAIISCMADPIRHRHYVLCLDKWSYGAGSPPLSYTLESGSKGVPKWVGGETHRLGADDLDAERLSGGARAEWRAAHELIRGMIGDTFCEATRLYAAAQALGIGKKMVWRASVELKVQRSREGFGPGSHVNWSPPRKGWPEDLEGFRPEPEEGQEPPPA